MIGYFGAFIAGGILAQMNLSFLELLVFGILAIQVCFYLNDMVHNI